MRAILTITALSMAFSLPAFAGNGNSDKHHHDGLPPGLQKNAERGKPLPPGWQKKLHRGDILDNDIYVRGRVVVPVGRDGSITIDVDGTLLRLHEKTRKILDILHP